MIAADKNKLKATLTQGVLQIQGLLIQLYGNNLTTLAAQAALIAAFSFTGYTEAGYNRTKLNDKLAYPFYFINAICVVTSLFIVSQATLVSIFGPTMALNGNSSEAVQTAVLCMEEQQLFILKLACVSVTTLFIACAILSWAHMHTGPAVVVTVVFIAVYYNIIKHGRRAYDMFRHKPKATPGSEKDNKQQGKAIEMRKTPSAGGGDLRASMDAMSVAGGSTSGGLTAIDAANTKARGLIYLRSSLSSGSRFEEVYAVLEKGTLDFYKNEQQYERNVNPINAKPVRLWEYALERDVSKFNQGMLGQTDFSMYQLMTARVDLRLAATRFRFALMPKVFSELEVLDVVELMATDDATYRLWTTAFKRVIWGHDELGGHDAVLAATVQPTQSRAVAAATTVENAVKAANVIVTGQDSNSSAIDLN